MTVLADQPSKREVADQIGPSEVDAIAEVASTDSELLTQFLKHRRQDSFTELVDRHASMVLGVCRRILRDEHEAEDRVSGDVF